MAVLQRPSGRYCRPPPRRAGSTQYWRFWISRREYFTLGLVGSPFGLEGLVKVRPISGETAHFTRLEKVTLRQNGKEKVWDVAEVVPRGDFLLIRFAGIDSPEAAAALKGAEIITGRENAAPLKEGEYYVEDLKGLQVVSVEGGVLGQVHDVIDGGGGQLVEVMLPAGKLRLVPFRNEFFGDVSLEKGEITLLDLWILE